jgi:hypothetical protein
MHFERCSLPSLVLCAVALTACVTEDHALMGSRYEASLAQWKGAPESRLVESWGRPAMSADLPDGRMLVFVTRHDYLNTSAMMGYHTLTPFGAPMIAQGLTAAPVIPAVCTTRFVVQNGVVSAWHFEGASCGATD